MNTIFKHFFFFCSVSIQSFIFIRKIVFCNTLHNEIQIIRKNNVLVLVQSAFLLCNRNAWYKNIIVLHFRIIVTSIIIYLAYGEPL